MKIDTALKRSIFERFMKWMKRDTYLQKPGTRERPMPKTWPAPPAKSYGVGHCCHKHLHPSAHYIEIAIEAIERAKYSKNYHDDLLLDHLNIAGDALDTAMVTLNGGHGSYGPHLIRQ